MGGEQWEESSGRAASFLPVRSGINSRYPHLQKRSTAACNWISVVDDFKALFTVMLINSDW